ncbi:hypothetical protein IVB33_33980 [Bradyrhizobium sp. 24]|nr:hypothetical protein [Bradyrhizobium sp. 24]
MRDVVAAFFFADFFLAAFFVTLRLGVFFLADFFFEAFALDGFFAAMRMLSTRLG